MRPAQKRFTRSSPRIRGAPESVALDRPRGHSDSHPGRRRPRDRSEPRRSKAMANVDNKVGHPGRHVLDERASSSSRSRAVPHFTPAERSCPRQGRARRAATLGARRVRAGAEAPRPGRSSRRAGGDASAGARSDPVRAHAGVAVHLLPRRCLPHGGRSRRRAAHGVARSALRRRAPLQLRDLRRAGSERVFSINDFDETLPGPFEWDVKRLAASFAVAARERGFHEGGPQLDRDDGGA